MTGRAIHARDPVVAEIPLIDDAIGRSDFAEQREAGAEHGGAFELVANVVRTDDRARVKGSPNPRNVHLAPGIHFHLDHRCDISCEAAMCGNAEATAFAGCLLAPAGFFRHHFYNPAQTRRVAGIGIARYIRVFVLAARKINLTVRTDQAEQILRLIFSGCMPQFRGKRLHREGVIDVGHAAQPSDADVKIRRAIFGTVIGNIEWHV